MEKLKDLFKIASTLSMEEFIQQFPHPFLFFSHKPGAVEKFSHTRLVDGPAEKPQIDRFSDQVLEFEPLLPNPHPGREFPERVFIGRDKSRDFVINHSTVSGRHACLMHRGEDNTWLLVDSGSTNGTFLRGRPLQAGLAVVLRDGDVVTFGRQDFIFFSPEGAYRYLRQFRLFKCAMQGEKTER